MWRLVLGLPRRKGLSGPRATKATRAARATVAVALASEADRLRGR